MNGTRTVRSYIPVVTSGHTLVGWIVRLSDGSSYFEQRKRVPRGACVNYGTRWHSS